MEELLKNKVAVVYGAGSIGGAVAKAFDKAGATVYVVDHNSDSLDRLKTSRIKVEQLDVLDKASVVTFIDQIIKDNGRIDISFTATSTHRPGGEQGAAFNELSYEDFSMPMHDYTKATFNTANAVYDHMKKQGSGVIMGITAIPARMPFPFTAGFGVGWAAVESMLRLLAAELGPYGVRTVCLQSPGSDGATDKTMTDPSAELDKRKENWGQRWMNRNLLNGRAPSIEEVGNMATFMASDLAANTTGTVISLDGGMVDR
jgi:3-oxoacyl-[acyl-carrier protein] reductase